MKRSQQFALVSSPPMEKQDTTYCSPIINEHSVCASAPGKVILFGEHAVVYGVSAWAAALDDLRIAVLLTPLLSSPLPVSNTQISSLATGTTTSSSSTTSTPSLVHIYMPDLPQPVAFSVPSRVILNLHSLQAPPTAACTSVCTQAIEEAIASHCNTSAHDNSHILDEMTVAALVPVIYLLHHLTPTCILEEHAEGGGGGGLAVWIRSKDLPVGAGLGSSAAMGVALTAALVQLQHRVLHDNNSNAIISNELYWSETTQQTPPDAARSIIDEYSYYSEMLLHGTPSGIDNAVSSHGGALLFTKNVVPDPTNASVTTGVTSNTVTTASKELVHDFPSLHLILVHTHVPRSTKALVAGVRKRYNRHRNVVLGILDSIRGISDEFKSILGQLSLQQQQSSESADQNHDLAGTRSWTPSLSSLLLELVRMNHHLLQALGVTHDSLDEIVRMVHTVAPDQAAAKLTGAGGGGCAMIILSPTLSSNEAESLRSRLIHAIHHPHEHGGYKIGLSNSLATRYPYECFSSKVGGPGVLWLNPKTHFPTKLPSSSPLSKSSSSPLPTSTGEIMPIWWMYAGAILVTTTATVMAWQSWTRATKSRY
jgi:mevalonate kinase